MSVFSVSKNPDPPRLFLLGLAAAAVVLTASPASAQTENARTVREQFTPEDFTRFAPRTALDMVNQIPGFVIREGGRDRGFGQADTNVLINGRRISGKSNGPVDALGRIPAASVERLEIIDGASLDIAGLSGQVLDVILNSKGGISGRYRYSPTLRTDDVPFRWGDGEISISSGGAKTEWSLSFENDQGRFGSTGPEIVRDGAGQLIDTRFEIDTEFFDQPGLQGSFTRTADNGNVLNLTGEVNAFIFDGRETSERTGVGQVDRERIFIATEDEFNFEVGADYAFKLGAGRLKLIGLHRFENSPTVADVRTIFADGRPLEGSVFSQVANEAETIVRAEYTFNQLGGDWQWSLEGVRNFLEIEAELEQFQPDGSLSSIDFEGANSRVDEDRAETTLSYSRALTPHLQIQTSLGVEYSQISQTGPLGQVRDFVRPNGFVSLNWKPQEDLNISTRLERVVGQLSFFDFIASVNLNQDRVDVTNADLVPPQSWLAEAEVQKGLGGYGTITLRGFGEDITDIVDQIPIADGGQAPGNLPSARRFGGSLDLTLLSDPTGWRGLRWDVSLSLVNSSVTDPLTGNPRPISDEDIVELDMTVRQDFLPTNWAIEFRGGYNESARQTRLDEISVFRQRPPFAQFIVENKDVFGTTMRLRVGNIFGANNRFSRTIFNDRLTNDIAFTEARDRTFGKIIRFDIEGSF
ncbi:MAG: TonB-dependent receptor plug domain-containing protein [Pseudomonadota bacterium]